MHSTQQVIKTIAIAFAIALICGIVSSLFYVGWTIGNLAELWRGDETTVSREEVHDLVVIHQYDDITRLEVKLDYGELEVKFGDELKIAANHDNLIRYDHSSSTVLKVEEIGRDFFDNHEATRVVIYVPSDLVFDNVKISTGAGRATIGDLTTKRMELNLGASKTEINNIAVTEQMKIDGGAGLIEVANSVLANLDFDMGVGRASIAAELIGKTQIDAGVGALLLNLQGDTGTSYGLEVEHGLGSVVINGEKRSGDVVLHGSGNNLVKIKGGVGSIEVNLRTGQD